MVSYTVSKENGALYVANSPADSDYILFHVERLNRVKAIDGGFLTVSITRFFSSLTNVTLYIIRICFVDIKQTMTRLKCLLYTGDWGEMFFLLFPWLLYSDWTCIPTIGVR